ncbi:carbohydrate ABC transporter permease [Streptacidiphilus sp. N1-10]|uniref:Carbohydrate ABC transporter permease n=1 Tax=Streptacidiphilus jeojiensis TaxID=3229225 RepID=A0ABV6XPE9_9ACTN
MRTGPIARTGRRGLLYLALTAGGLLWLYPFLWAIGGSLKSDDDFFATGLDPFTTHPQWSNYSQAWEEGDFGRYFLNTVLFAGGTVVLTVLATAMAGYVLARTEFPGRKAVLALIGATLFLPHGYTIIPVFDLIQRLHLLNTLWALIIVQSASGMVFGTFLFMGYFSTIDRGLEEAARVDGADFHQVFWRIMLPLSGPMLATVALFSCINAWNSFFVPLVFTLSRPDLHTLTVGMFTFLGENSTAWTLVCAGSVITLLPIVAVFLGLQRYFVNGLAGAVKE